MKKGSEQMKSKLCILAVVLLLRSSQAFCEEQTKTYIIRTFVTSNPTLANSIVGDDGDSIAQIGSSQAWFCFDLTEIPDSEEIISVSFTARLDDYTDNITTERTLWYDPDDDWKDTWHHDPDYIEPKVLTELVAVISFNHDGLAYITTDVDISEHDWSNDLIDNYVTLMLTGPLSGYYSAGYVDLDSPLLELVTTSSQDDINKGTLLNLGPEELVQAKGIDIQVPGYSVPSFVDWNNDKLGDLVIGEGGGYGYGKVRVYLNVGTESDPQFSDYFYAQSKGSDLVCLASGCMGCFPRVVYWDADDRKDLLVGQSKGTIKIFLNTGTDENPTFDGGRALQLGNINIIDVQAQATPTVVDWNNDGRKDLVVGSRYGRIYIYLNEGTDTEPVFLTETFVQKDGLDLIVPSHRSSPVVLDLDGDGSKDILTGNTYGQLLFYSNVGTDEEPRFSGYSLIESNGVAIDLSGQACSRPFVCYWTGDGYFGPIDAYPDVLVGARDGKVHLYQGIPVTGDLDGNGVMDFADFALFAAYWDQTNCAQCDIADFTDDGKVDIDDLCRFVANWLKEGS